MIDVSSTLKVKQTDTLLGLLQTRNITETNKINWVAAIVAADTKEDNDQNVKNQSGIDAFERN